jgi:ParB family chromosome partitioning protein
MDQSGKARKLGKGLAGLIGVPVTVPLPPQGERPAENDKKQDNFKITEQNTTFVTTDAGGVRGTGGVIVETSNRGGGDAGGEGGGGGVKGSVSVASRGTVVETSNTAGGVLSGGVEKVEGDERTSAAEKGGVPGDEAEGAKSEKRKAKIEGEAGDDVARGGVAARVDDVGGRAKSGGVVESGRVGGDAWRETFKGSGAASDVVGPRPIPPAIAEGKQNDAPHEASSGSARLRSAVSRPSSGFAEARLLSPARESEGAATPYLVVRVDEVMANRFQPRQDFDESSLALLAASIKRDGVMQPLVVRAVGGGKAKSEKRKAEMKSGEGGASSRSEVATRGGEGGGGSDQSVGGAKWELVAGERRWRAAQVAGLTHVPAVVVDVDDMTAALWAVVENVQRVDLGPLEKSTAYARLSKEFGLTQQQIADQVGEDRTLVSHYIRLGDLEPEVISLLRAGKLSFGHAKVLNSPMVKKGVIRVKLAQRAVRDVLSVRQLEQLVQRGAGEKLEYVETTAWTPQYVTGHDDPPFDQYEAGEIRSMEEQKRWDAEARAAAQAKALEGRANVRDLEEQISKQLGTRVRIKTSGGGKRGVISLEYYSLDHFDGLLKTLGVKRES